MIPRRTTSADDVPTRRRAYIEAAREMFFTHGYAGTTMSSIAAAVGGSKTTLWGCFSRKEDLFAAVVDDIVDRFGQALAIELDHDQPVDVALRELGIALLNTLLSGPIVSLHRLVTGEAGRFPEIGALFYEHGPRRGKAKLAGYIAAMMDDGRLRHGDPALAARQFSAMCQSGSFHRVLYAMGPPDPDVIAGEIDAAVDSFMRAWGPDART